MNKVALTSAQFNEQSTSKTVVVDGMNVHYHDVGSGYPVVMLHSYGPGTTGWITFHKVLPALAEHFRCIVRTCPISAAPARWYTRSRCTTRRPGQL